jgi:hypothetical protein
MRDWVLLQLNFQFVPKKERLSMRDYCICGKILGMEIEFDLIPYIISLCLCIPLSQIDFDIYYLL